MRTKSTNEINPSISDQTREVDEQIHHDVYYADTGFGKVKGVDIDGKAIVPELTIGGNNTETYQLVLDAVKTARTATNGVYLTMRDRLDKDDPDTFVTRPTDRDLMTGSEIDHDKHWSKGDYNPRVFRGEMARQIRMAIGEAAVMAKYNTKIQLPAIEGEINKKPTHMTEELEKIQEDDVPSVIETEMNAVHERVTHIAS